jgi:hypothetical protein
MDITNMTQEALRLEEMRSHRRDWKRWGPQKPASGLGVSHLVMTLAPAGSTRARPTAAKMV